MTYLSTLVAVVPYRSTLVAVALMFAVLFVLAHRGPDPAELAKQLGHAAAPLASFKDASR